MELGRLNRINPRTVWPHEAADFTPWLRENIDYLAEAVGVDIQLVESEVAVGDFSVDLVGEEPGQSRPVIIENQLERTNHTHLGQLLTYAAGKNGGVVIWVAPEFRPEHREALEWLNDATRGNLDFFGVELEVLQIDDSRPAPNFKVVVRPKAAATSRRPASGQNSSADLNRRYQEYFQDLLREIRNRQPDAAGRVTNNGSLMVRVPSGRAGFWFRLAFASRNRFHLETYIDTGEASRNKSVFEWLEAHQAEIEQQYHAELEWDWMNNRRACRISQYYPDGVNVMDSPEDLDRLREWTVENFLRFREVMLPYIQGAPLAPVDYDPEFEDNAEMEV